MGIDEKGLLFASWCNHPRVVRRTFDGKWETLGGYEVLINNTRTLYFPEFPAIYADRKAETSYIIFANPLWSTAAVYQIGPDAIRPPSLILRGCESEYFARWKRLFVGLLFAWLLHLVIIVGGTAWCTQAARQTEYCFGIQRVTLASPWRRTVALSIDLLLASIILYLLLLIYTQMYGSEVEANQWTGTQLYYSLFACDEGIADSIEQTEFSSSLTYAIQSSLEAVIPALRDVRASFDLVIIEAIFLFCLRIYTERRFGITPGKWLLRIRTVQSTLRPASFSRVLARSALYAVDLPLLITPIPAAISMMFSQNVQRLGDRVADTIVVNINSNRTLESEANRGTTDAPSAEGFGFVVPVNRQATNA